MISILSKTATFLIIILLGFALKRKGVLKKEDAQVVSQLIVNLTLPCMILSSTTDIQVNHITLILIAFAIGINLFTFYFGIATSRKEPSRMMQSVAGLNISGFNIGNYAIPFVSSFFAGSAVGYICMFDIGNSLCGFGLIYFLSCVHLNSDSHFDMGELRRKLLGSVPFLTYLLVFILSLLRLRLPDFILSPVSVIGSANTFLSMILIGLLLELPISLRELKNAGGIIGRRLMAQALCALILLVLPVPAEVKVIMLFCIFTPVTSVTPVYCIKVGYDGPIPAIVSTVTMMSSILIYVVLLLLFS